MAPAPADHRPRSNITYADATALFGRESVRADLRSALAELAQGLVAHVSTCDAIAAQLPPDAPRARWDALRTDLRAVVWQMRALADSISGRLRIYCSVILPLVTRADDARTGRLHAEKMQILQSYMSISADQASLTGALATAAQRLNMRMTEFHAALVERSPTLQPELRELQRGVTQLNTIVTGLYAEIGRLVGVDVVFLAFSAFRVATFLGRQGRAEITGQAFALVGVDLATTGRMYAQLDGVRAELAGVERTLPPCTPVAVGTLVSAQAVAVAAGVALFQAVWMRLQTDCTAIFRWLHSTRGHPTFEGAPPPVVCYLANGRGLYTAIANALVAFVEETAPLAP